MRVPIAFSMARRVHSAKVGHIVAPVVASIAGGLQVPGSRLRGKRVRHFQREKVSTP
jgi:hypothetical protein